MLWITKISIYNDLLRVLKIYIISLKMCFVLNHQTFKVLIRIYLNDYEIFISLFSNLNFNLTEKKLII